MAFSISQIIDTVSNDGMIREWTGEDIEGNGSRIIWGTTLEFVSTDENHKIPQIG
jgi:hypothetical protein